MLVFTGSSFVTAFLDLAATPRKQPISRARTPPTHWATMVARMDVASPPVRNPCAVAAGLRALFPRPETDIASTRPQADLMLLFLAPDVRMAKMKMKVPCGA
jgi:hypothetical protein